MSGGVDMPHGALHATSLLLLLVGCATEHPSRKIQEAPSRLASRTDTSTQDTVDPNEHSELDSLLRHPELDLEELLRAVDQLNPDIAAACEELGAAAGRLEQSRLYPNPTLDLEAEDVPARDVGLGRGKETIGITQPLILGSRRRAAISAATADEQVRLFRLEATRRAVLADMRAAYGEAVFVRQSSVVYDELLGVAHRTLEIARTRFDARAVPEAEALRAELEVYELELGMRRVEQERAAIGARIRALLGGAEIALDAIGSELPAGLGAVDLTQLRRRVRDGNSELAAARAEIEAADRRIETARAERIPDVDLRLAYGQDAADQDIYEAGVLIPLPIFDRNQGRIREARHLAVKARREADAIQGRLETELADAFASHASARAAALTIRERIVPATERALAQVRDSYEAGRTDLLNLLDAQRSNARARLSLIQALRDASIAEARLWKLADIELFNPSTEGDGE